MVRVGLGLGLGILFLSDKYDLSQLYKMAIFLNTRLINMEMKYTFGYSLIS